MSLLPYFFDEPWQRRRPTRLLDQDFGLAITPDDILTAVARPVIPRDYFRQWRQLANLNDVESNIKADKDKFQINLDVQHFSPEEISVKATDGHIVIEGKHEEKEDQHGYVSRQFVRRYALPKGCQVDAVESKLSSDGVLTITAPRQPPAVKGERNISIQHTGPVRKEIKDGTETQEKPKSSL